MWMVWLSGRGAALNPPHLSVVPWECVINADSQALPWTCCSEAPVVGRRGVFSQVIPWEILMLETHCYQTLWKELDALLGGNSVHLVSAS